MSCRRLVFDTGPLSSFAVVARLDLLEAICAGHGSWPLSVQRELRAGARALPALACAYQVGFLGVPEVLEHSADILEAELLRVAGTTDLLARAVRMGLLRPEGARELHRAMLAAGRRPGPLPGQFGA